MTTDNTTVPRPTPQTAIQYAEQLLSSQSRGVILKQPLPLEARRGSGSPITMDEIRLDRKLRYFYVPGAQARHVSLDKDGGRAETGIRCAMARKHDGSMWCGAIRCSNSKSKCPDLSFNRFPKDPER